jgi:hypothetical protein
MKKAFGRGLAGAAVAAMLTAGLGQVADAVESPPIYAVPGGPDLGALLGPTTGLPQTVLAPVFGVLP